MSHLGFSVRKHAPSSKMIFMYVLEGNDYFVVSFTLFFFTKCHLRKIQEFRFVLHVKQGYTSMVRDGQGTVLNSLDDYIHCHIPTYSVIL